MCEHCWNHVFASLDRIDERQFEKLTLLTPKAKGGSGKPIGGYKIHLSGGPETDTLENDLHRVINADNRGVLLSLVDVAHINSTGLAVLINAQALATRHGKYFALINVDPKIVNIFVFMKLRHVFKNFDSVQQAVDDYYATHQK